MTPPTSTALRSIPLNDLSRGISRDRHMVLEATEAVLDSGYLIMGPQHAAFERALAAYVGVRSAVGVASGTDALELAMRSAMPSNRHTVLCAANAGGYASIAARRAGYHLKYADVDELTHCLSWSSIADLLEDDIGVVVITHLYGNLTDIRDLVAHCHARGIRVIEDCAQALGARNAHGAAGSFGDLGAISFYPTKNLGALGDGGAVVTDSPEMASSVMRLRQYGWAHKYHVAVAGGVNSRLDELQAAFLLRRLPMLDGFNERRRSIVARYVEAARGTRVGVLPADGTQHAAHLAVILTEDRDRVRSELAEVGVATDVHFPVPDHLQPGFAAEPVALEVTERLSKTVVSLPCFPEMDEDEIEYVCWAIGSLR